MCLHELDDLSIAVCRLLRFTAGFVDHAETVIPVVHFGEVLDQGVSGLFCLVELLSFDQIDDGVGGGIEFIAPLGELVVLSLLFGQSRGEGDRSLSLILLILLKTTALIFFSAAARAEVVSTDLGCHDAHFTKMERDSDERSPVDRPAISSIVVGI